MSQVFTPESILAFKKCISAAKNFVVTAHKSPDGDAVGSALAMYHLLIKLDKNAVVILPDAVPEFLHWLPQSEKIVSYDTSTELAGKLIEEAEVIFALDYNVLSRTGKEMEQSLKDAKADFVLIDHHQQPGDFASISFSEVESCSTCQLVYELIEKAEYADLIDIAMAECIYCGIVTDSGSFRYPSVTQETHRISGKLIAMGLDHAEVHRRIFDTNLMDRLRLVGYALSEKLELIDDSGTAFISLNKDELTKYNYRQGDTEGLANQALSIKGVKLAAFFREGNNEIKISFRSQGKFDVNQFARKNWNGGGHSNAAGGISQQSLVATIEKFKLEIKSLREEILAS